MINISDKNEIPDNARLIREQGDGTFNVYFSDDEEIMAQDFRQARSDKLLEIKSTFSNLEKKLSVDKEQYKDLRDASLVGIGHKGMNPAETMMAFKDAVVARKALQDRRDELLDLALNATVISEVESIIW